MRIKRAIIASCSSAAISLAAYALGAISRGGTAASTAVGSSVIYHYGHGGMLILGSFFSSGSLLSRLNTPENGLAKSYARNGRQVLANGGVAAASGLAKAWLGSDQATAIMAGSLAAATSDTWATEFGVRFGRNPRYVISGLPVRAGLSGGVTPVGTIASVGGAMSVGAVTAALYKRPMLGLVAALAGIVGSIFDTVLGELVQVKRRSTTTGELVEDNVPDESSAIVSGWHWLNNDVVNLACTLSGGVSALVLWRVAAPASRPSTSCGVQQASSRSFR